MVGMLKKCLSFLFPLHKKTPFLRVFSRSILVHTVQYKLLRLIFEKVLNMYLMHTHITQMNISNWNCWKSFDLTQKSSLDWRCSLYWPFLQEMKQRNRNKNYFCFAIPKSTFPASPLGGVEAYRRIVDAQNYWVVPKKEKLKILLGVAKAYNKV